MKSRRRNRISPTSARFVLFIALASGIIAAFAGCRPTGEAVPDAFVTASFVVFVVWAAGSAPWWVLLIAAGVAAVMASGSLVLVAGAFIGLAAAVWLGLQKQSAAPVRAFIAAIALQALLRSDSNPWFLATALAAGSVAVLIVVSGLARRPGFVRRRVLRGAMFVGLAAVAAMAGMIGGGLSAKTEATDGYADLQAGLNSLRGGDTQQAAALLRTAARHLNAASDDFTAPWTQPARLLPVFAQHRGALSTIVHNAAKASAAAAKTLDLIDLDQLTVQTGVIDVEALALLAEPLSELQTTVTALASALDNASSPWLFAPFQSRLHSARNLADEVIRQAETSVSAAQEGPRMLGIDGPRRYFIAFTSSAEARGQTGLMGNWAEITITRGRLQLSAKGRSSELIKGLAALPNVTLQASAEYFARYGQFGAGEQGGTVIPKYWSNITMSPDTPTVGSVMAQLYQQSTGRAVDGVFIIDPAGIAALLDLAGPVELVDLGVSLNSLTVEQFLLLDQYTRPESEREDILAAVTDATVDQVLGSRLPGPQVVAADLGPAATQGHISGWATRESEQRVFELAGIDAALPALGGRDGLAVVNDNASANKIDSFLEREVHYEATFDERTGRTTSVASVTLTNTAPTTGYPDYVIGNKLGLPLGTNRTVLSVYSPLFLQNVTIDGVTIGNFVGSELGWNVYSTLITLAPGETLTVDFTLAGALSPGRYEFVYRPQPLRLSERLFVRTVNGSGRTLAGYAGSLKRRSVLSGRGLEVWR